MRHYAQEAIIILKIIISILLFLKLYFISRNGFMLIKYNKSKDIFYK